MEELDKCIILCNNCHTEEHSDLDFFEKNKEEIILKSNNLKRLSQKINRNEVKKMYENGMNQKEISTFFNCSKSTISEIIKELNINKEYRIDYEAVKDLYNKGLKSIEISRMLKINSNTIYSVIKKLKMNKK